MSRPKHVTSREPITSVSRWHTLSVALDRIDGVLSASHAPIVYFVQYPDLGHISVLHQLPAAKLPLIPRQCFARLVTPEVSAGRARSLPRSACSRSLAAMSSWEFSPLPKRCPDAYGPRTRSNQKRCFHLIRGSFKDGAQRARERSRRYRCLTSQQTELGGTGAHGKAGN